MIRETKASLHTSMRRNTRAAVAVVVFLLGGIAVWAASTQISGAVIAPGNVVVDSNAKKVQHPTGGIVSEVRVRDGDHVRAGDLLVRLDETVTRANLSIVSKDLDQLTAQKARLEAERDGLDDVLFPTEITSRATDPQVARTIEGEKKLFTLRRSARTGQKDQLTKRVDQLREELTGYESQERAKAREMELIEKQLVGARTLWEKHLMPMTQIHRDPAGRRASRRRARGAGRYHGPDKGQDFRDGTANHAGRSRSQ